MHPSHRFLLKLLPFYHKKGSEQYILSRLALLDPKISAELQALFCPRCLHLFIPTVNCKIIFDDMILVKCYNCGHEILCTAFCGVLRDDELSFDEFLC